MNPRFDFMGRTVEADYILAEKIIGNLHRPPDLVIAPSGHGEYLFRWYVIPRNKNANVYFHVQTQSDPERPLHDHPWDNTSVILAGGYDEIISKCPWVNGDYEGNGFDRSLDYRLRRYVGDVIYRQATWAHRLILPPDTPYTMTLFMTGPKVREWGFWEGGKFSPFKEVTVKSEGKSSWKGSME